MHILEEEFGDIYDPNKLSKDEKRNIDNAANKFMESASSAERFFGSPDIVQSQLNLFNNRNGDS